MVVWRPGGIHYHSGITTRDGCTERSQSRRGIPNQKGQKAVNAEKKIQIKALPFSPHD
jgi:hypothetical protein